MNRREANNTEMSPDPATSDGLLWKAYVLILGLWDYNHVSGRDVDLRNSLLDHLAQAGGVNQATAQFRAEREAAWEKGQKAEEKREREESREPT